MNTKELEQANKAENLVMKGFFNMDKNAQMNTKQGKLNYKNWVSIEQ